MYVWRPITRNIRTILRQHPFCKPTHSVGGNARTSTCKRPGPASARSRPSAFHPTLWAGLQNRSWCRMVPRLRRRAETCTMSGGRTVRVGVVWLLTTHDGRAEVAPSALGQVQFVDSPEMSSQKILSTELFTALWASERSRASVPDRAHMSLEVFLCAEPHHAAGPRALMFFLVAVLHMTLELVPGVPSFGALGARVPDECAGRALGVAQGRGSWAVASPGCRRTGRRRRCELRCWP
jgi:hypothetical protein